VEKTNFPQAGDNKKVSLSNSQYPQFNYAVALKLKEDFPKTWRRGGNIYGNTAFVRWSAAKSGNKSKAVEAWIRKREAWAARHYQDFRVPGVVAQIKWGVIGKLGESEMRKLIQEQIEKDYPNA
jgi:hypothetical protein